MTRYSHILLLVLVTVICYAGSADNQFVWDDVNNIVRNGRLNEPLEAKDIFLTPADPFYRPIPFLSIWFDYLLWRDNPFGYHLSNVLFHIFNVILIYYVALTLSTMGREKGEGLSVSNPVSLISALLFAAHPVHTEAVTYISGRSDPIASFFLFASFFCYLQYLKSAGYKRTGLLTVTLSLFLMGLFSKEIALIFPLLLFAYDVCFIDNPFKTRLKRALPFILLSAGFLFFRYLFVRLQPKELAIGPIHASAKIFLYYIRLLLFPFNLHMQHSLTETSLLLRMLLILSTIIFAGSIIVISRHTLRKRVIFGLIWFFIGLSPFLGIFKFSADIAEHWLYFPSFGFFFMMSGIFIRKNLLRQKITVSVLVLLLAVITIQRNNIWQDDIRIYNDTLKYRPHDYKLHYNLGNAYLRRQLFNEAFKEYKIALKINPDYSYAINNLAIVLEAFAEEERHFGHSLYGEVLSAFLKDGRVDYSSLQKDPSTLDSYLKKVAELNTEILKAMPRDGRLAFYINAYNAFTLKVVVDNYPVKSIKAIPGVWDKIKFKVAQRELTLNYIEHEILRKEFRDPRAHFGLVCASKGCPVLAREPFTGAEIDEQLDRETRKFINDETKVRLDRGAGILYLSSIFKWFKGDFGDLLLFVSEYLPEEDAKFIREKRPRLRYLRYDWSLNDISYKI